MNEASSPPAPRGWIVSRPAPADAPSEQPLRLFGLSPAERARRALRAAGVGDVVEAPAPPPELSAGESAVVVLRDDFVLDPRLFPGLVAQAGVALVAPGSGAVVAAHVPPARVGEAAAWMRGEGAPAAGDGVRPVAPGELAPGYTAALRSAKPPYVVDVSRPGPEDARRLEERIFADAYKGVTDLVTKWVWPRPALFVVRRCAAAGISPNAVTLASWVLVAIAFLCFASGAFALGLGAAWAMTFLDTVDGKLARVTITSSRAGHVLDHGLDLVHPPFWWWAFGAGIGLADPAVATSTWICVGGYVAGRAVEGIFLLLFGIEIHSWRPLDSFFRTITARRNPNLVLLTVATAAGRPDVGLHAVAAWTVLSIAFHAVRVLQAARERRRGRPVAPWYAAPSAAAVATILALATAGVGPGLAAPRAAQAAGTSGAPADADAAARSRLGPGELATEQWDLTIRLDSGHFVLAQFLVTNIGLGDANAAVTGHVVAPDGVTTRFRQGKSADAWRMSEDGLRLEVGKASFDQHGAESRLRVARKKLRLDLVWPAAGPSSAAGALAADGYALDLLASGAPVTGTLWTEGMGDPIAARGRAFVTHRSMDGLEARVVQRRTELVAWPGDTTLYLFDALRPEGAPAERWLVVRRGDATLLQTAEVSLDFDTGGDAAGEGFARPRELRFRAPGAEGRARFAREIVRYEPLADLPAPIRVVVAAATRPLRSWSDAEVELRLATGAGGAPEGPVLRGGGVGEVTFLNPVRTRMALAAGRPAR